MIDHIWTVLCRNTVTDRESNNISIQGVLEQINITGPKGEGIVPIEAELVTLWSRSKLDQPERTRSRFRLVDPDGKQVGKDVVYDVDLTTHARSRNKIKMSGFPVKAPGKYEFCVDTERDRQWIQVARVPLEVRIQIEGQDPAAAKPN